MAVTREQGLKWLREKEKKLKEDVERQEKEFKEEVQTQGNGSASDPADMPAPRYAGVLNRHGQLEQLRRALDKVRRVIIGLEAGALPHEYGFCCNPDCSKEIPEKRLRLFPETSLCVDCKGAEEASRKSTFRGYKTQRKPSYSRGIRP